MSIPMKPNDPAFWMLQTGKRLEAEGVTGDLVVGPDWLQEKEVHRDGCYICEDPEFRLMGLPLCKACPQCSAEGNNVLGHIAADDEECDDCGYNLREHYEAEQEAKGGDEVELNEGTFNPNKSYF
jgi:hypothetical protein